MILWDALAFRKKVDEMADRTIRLHLEYDEHFAPSGALPLDRPAIEAETASTVLVVDDQDINLRVLHAVLKTENYQVREARRASDALEILSTEKIDLVILDLVMPDMSSLEFCRRIKSSQQTRLIPVLIITSVQGVENEIACITSGADEFLLRPLHPSVVRTRIRAMLRTKTITDRLEEAEAILFALAQAIEGRDKYTFGHCQRLALHAVSLGIALGLSKRELQALYRGGYLHDIGKVCVPDMILFRPGALSDQEWVLMRAHTVRGEEICRPLQSLAPVLPIIRSHHERWDGSGYPDGLRGDQIPLVARVLQIADIYDALTTARPYKPAFSAAQTLAILDEESKNGWRDPDLVSLFREMHEKIHVGLDRASAALQAADFESMHLSLMNMQRELIK
jgi:putative two-component system response regulator